MCLLLCASALDLIYDKDGKHIGYNKSSYCFKYNEKHPKDDLLTSKRDKRTVRLSDKYKNNKNNHELRHILRMIGEYKNRLNWQNFLNESIEEFKKNLNVGNRLKLKEVKDKINRCKKRFPKFLHSWFDKHVAPRILEREYHPSPVYYTDTNGVRHNLTEMQ